MTDITVKCLTEEDKDSFVRQYERKTMKMKDLAKVFDTSPRTLNRVLEERGLATPVPRLKGEAHQVMRLIGSYGLNAEKLGLLLKTVSTSTPLNPNVQEIMKIVRGYGMSAEQLEAALKAPAVTTASVQGYLNQCSKEQLAIHFYTSGLVKIAEIAKHAHAAKQQQQQAPVTP